jgi:endonuclease/exonuclease/phosphatase family metal-dependent hydrolase
MSLPTVLQVLTLNVWGLPWPFALDRGRRFARIARHFADRRYDVIGVQEAWWPFGSRVPIPGLRLGRGDSGLGLGGAILDAKRGVDTELLRFDRLLRARIHDLTVGVTHLQASDGAEPIRLRQVEQIVEWLAGEIGPVLLMGDFNFGANDRAAERRLERAGLRDVGSDTPTFSPRNPFARTRSRERYDRIYVRDSATMRWLAQLVRVFHPVWSDHWPVHAELALQRA